MHRHQNLVPHAERLREVRRAPKQPRNAPRPLALGARRRVRPVKDRVPVTHIRQAAGVLKLEWLLRCQKGGGEREEASDGAVEPLRDVLCLLVRDLCRRRQERRAVLYRRSVSEREDVWVGRVCAAHDDVHVVVCEQAPVCAGGQRSILGTPSPLSGGI